MWRKYNCKIIIIIIKKEYGCLVLVERGGFAFRYSDNKVKLKDADENESKNKKTWQHFKNSNGKYLGEKNWENQIFDRKKSRKVILRHSYIYNRTL